MKYTSMFGKVLVAILAIWSNTAGAQGPFNIGTINPGDSIVIIYDVSINTGATGSITNQGTITGTPGINAVTDDPDTGPGNDPTITMLNVFPLPVTFTEFRAYQKQSDIELSWKVTETGIDKYEIERSTDGRTFYKIGEVMATNSSGLVNHIFLDTHPNAGNNFYRLRVIENTTTPKYTSIVKVSIGGMGALLSMYPNPVTDKVVNIEMKKVAAGSYTFTLFNATGQKVFSRQINHAGGSAAELITLPTNITKGMYHVQIKGETMIVNKILLIN